jgi:hypothetical protein
MYFGMCLEFLVSMKSDGAVWWLELQLPMQSVPITTEVVSLNLDKGKVYIIMW